MLYVVPTGSTPSSQDQQDEDAVKLVVPVVFNSIGHAYGVMTYLHCTAGLALACLARADGADEAKILDAVSELVAACATTVGAMGG